MFGYGCLTTALMLYAYFSFAVLRRHDVPEFITRVGSAEMWIYVAGAHMLTFVATLAGGGMGERAPLWDPLFPPTARSILVGRIILLAATCNFLFWDPYIYLRLDDRGAPWCAVAAMLLLSTTYTAVHWALRPENVLSWPVLRFLRGSSSNRLMRPIVERAIARRPAMPLGEWLPELLRCCELAVNSKRLVSSETPGEGEIDCLDSKVLYWTSWAQERAYCATRKACLVTVSGRYKSSCVAWLLWIGGNRTKPRGRKQWTKRGQCSL